MKIERQQALGVDPYQPGETRRGQANGFKAKTIKTRAGFGALGSPSSRRFVLSLVVGAGLA